MGSAAPRRFRRLPFGTILGFTVPVATHLWPRLLGLAFLDRERAGEGLLIPRCRSVHTFGMRFHLDLIFVGPDDRVIEVRRGIGPNRLIRCRRAAAVLELPTES